MDDTRAGDRHPRSAIAGGIAAAPRAGMTNLSLDTLATVTGGASTDLMTRIKNAASGFVGGLACLGKFTVDGTPGTNSYDTYLACQRKAHQF